MTTALKKLREATDPDALTLRIIDLINSTDIEGNTTKLARSALGVSNLRVLYEVGDEKVNLTVILKGRDKVTVTWEGGRRSPDAAQRALRLYQKVVDLATGIESLT